MTMAFARNTLWLFAGGLLALSGSFLFHLRPESAEPVSSDMNLEQSLDAPADAIREAGSFVAHRKNLPSTHQRPIMRVLVE